MKAESSQIEEIINMGSFRKGLRVEWEARMRSEKNTVLALGIIFGLGIVTGLWISERRRGE